MDAKQDITHRLQGRLWGVPVRLAYGSESSPETTPELRSSASNAAAPVSDAAPSSMLLIRPVPSAVSSADLVNLLTPLGPVEHARLTAQQPQGALVVMRDVESAVRMAVALSGREIWGAEQGPVKGQSLNAITAPLNRTPANASRTTTLYSLLCKER